MSNSTQLTVTTLINAPISKVWTYWTLPEHITSWCTATEEWHTPRAENDLKTGGKFLTRMEAKDGSFGFDFIGTYSEVIHHKKIAYIMEDGRKAEIHFKDNNNQTEIIETFDAETENSLELQQNGWQAILNNFKFYTENN